MKKIDVQDEDIKISKRHKNTSVKKSSDKNTSVKKLSEKKPASKREHKAFDQGMKVSQRLFVTGLVILLCMLLIGVYFFLADKFYKSRQLDDLDTNVRMQAEILSDKLKSNEFVIEGEDKSLFSDVEDMAAYFDGRVIVVNNDYRIIEDTFGYNNSNFIISSQVISIMTGETASYRDNKGEYIEYIFPVMDTDGEVKNVILVNASTEHITEVSRYILNKIRLVAVIMGIACIGAAVFIGWVSVKGIKSVGRYMEKMGDGHLDERIPLKGFKEIRVVAENYNSTMEKLMTIDTTRQEFVSNVSHELKTPITSMKVLADSLVQNEDADLKMYKEFMSDIVEEVDRESKIITDLLTLVKTDKSSSKMNIEEININSLLEIILKRVTPIAEKRSIEITYESYREVVAEVDEVKLSLALTNIIENAVKYNVDNGSVRVTLNADHKYFHIKVADTGVGIPDDCKDKVFERFYRVDKARSRDTGGTGLGLSITRNVVMMHKGTIKLYSESGEGTTFTVKIPLKYTDNGVKE